MSSNLGAVAMFFGMVLISELYLILVDFFKKILKKVLTLFVNLLY